MIYLDIVMPVGVYGVYGEVWWFGEISDMGDHD